MGFVASLIAESRVREFDPGQYHTFVEKDNGILSLFIQEGLLTVTSDSCVCVNGLVISLQRNK